MTKAEIKKMETEKKCDFITIVYDAVLHSISVEIRGYRKRSLQPVTAFWGHPAKLEYAEL